MQDGSRWEVLLHALEVEEPGGVVCIQAVLNDPTHSVMVMQGAAGEHTFVERS